MNLIRWQALSDHKAEMAEVFGGELLFDDLPDNKGCRIESRFNGPKINDRDQWPAVLDWMIDTQERLRKAVSHVGGIPSVTAGAGP